MSDEKIYQVVLTEVLTATILVRASEDGEAYRKAWEVMQSGGFMWETSDRETAIVDVLDEVDLNLVEKLTVVD